MLGIGFNVVSRLRHDAALYYLWDCKPTGKPGRPRVKGDKIDYENIDKSKVKILCTDVSKGRVYALKAWCQSLHRKISLVIHILPNGGHRLYFSTDENMNGRDVMEYYNTRFQIEFCFRDAKQFVGLCDCQARDKRKLDFAFNSSFTATNIAQIMCKEYNLSIGKLKEFMIKAYYAQRTQVSDLDLGRHSVCFKSSQSLVIFNDLHNQIFRFSPSYFSHDRHDFYYDSPYFFDNS